MKDNFSNFENFITVYRKGVYYYLVKLEAGLIFKTFLKHLLVT